MAWKKKVKKDVVIEAVREISELTNALRKLEYGDAKLADWRRATEDWDNCRYDGVLLLLYDMRDTGIQEEIAEELKRIIQRAMTLTRLKMAILVKS